MSSDLDDLYQEVILDHGTKPRNFRAIPQADGKAEGFNPLCGDRVVVYLKLDGDTVSDAAFEGVGCAICKSSTSMMIQAVLGRTTEEVDSLFHGFHTMLTEQSDGMPHADQLGKLAVFSGVCKFPMRVKCATLPWHTLLAALEGVEKTVTTE